MSLVLLRKDRVTLALEVWRRCAERTLVVLEKLLDHTGVVLLCLFAICAFVVYQHIAQLKTQMVTAIAYRGAETYVRALFEMQDWYTTEVFERQHKGKTSLPGEGSTEFAPLPLPDVLSRQVGSQLVSGRAGERLRLLSAYPFSGNNGLGSLSDDFQKEAWEFLLLNPDQSFYRLERIDNHESLRYAKAHRMEQACVDCHNAHPESPKRDWQVGEVGGMVEVVYPLTSLESLTGTDWSTSYGMVALLGLCCVGGFGLVFLKLRRVSVELENRVRARISDLREANRQLELEIYERHLAEETLRQARDNLEKRVQERTGKLAASNAELIREVSERKRAEEDIRHLNSQLVQRSAQLEASNKELEAFSYSVSHDLRAPLRGIDGFAQAILEDYEEKLDDSGKSYLHRVRAASQRMSQLIDAMLNLARLTRAEIHTQTFEISTMVESILEELQKGEPDRSVELVVTKNLFATADPQLIRAVLENLLGNAWKFTRKQDHPRLEFGHGQYKGQAAFYVKDNGAGFDMTYVHKLFGAFQRLHAYTEYPGVGIGLATVHRIIQRHGGQIWAEGAVDEGATFHFTL